MTERAHSAEWQRGWDACMAGRTLTLGLCRCCASEDFSEGYLACMLAHMKPYRD